MGVFGVLMVAAMYCVWGFGMIVGSFGEAADVGEVAVGQFVGGGWGWGMLGSLSDVEMEVASVAAFVVWPLVFGYVSRRFERQADTFAVKHVVSVSSGADVIDDRSVNVVSGALWGVAALNHVPATRRSWRHGSIEWRVNYLRSLVGRRVDRCLIDRQVKWMKLGAVVVVVVGICLLMR